MRLPLKSLTRALIKPDRFSQVQNGFDSLPVGESLARGKPCDQAVRTDVEGCQQLGTVELQPVHPRDHGRDVRRGISVVADRDGFRPDSQVEDSSTPFPPAGQGLDRLVPARWAVGADGSKVGRVAVSLDLAGEQVHGRAADERGDESVRRAVVDRTRRVALANLAFLENDDAITHDQGLRLVVSDVDERCLESSVKLDDFLAQYRSKGDIEVRKRFVKEDDPRLAHECSADCHTLALAAGKRTRFSVEQAIEAENPRDVIHSRSGLGARDATSSRAEDQVAEDRQMGVEHRVLEDHRHVAAMGGDCGHRDAIDRHASRRGRLKTSDQPEDRALARPGRAQQNEQLSCGNREIDRPNCVDRARINLCQLVKLNGSQWVCSLRFFVKSLVRLYSP